MLRRIIASHIPLMIIASTLVTNGAEPAGGALVLSAKGEAMLPVVVSEKASERTRKVAGELADFLSRITRCKFTVENGDGSRGIVVGTLTEFPQPDLVKALAIRNTFDGKEAYAIRTQPQRLLLIGSTDLAVSHAAFRLLEELGCRWFFPAKEWEVVPSRPDLVVNLNEADRPALLARRIWYGYGFFDRNLPRCREDYEAWARHNRMSSSFQTWCGHAWQSIIAANQKSFDAHPEYLALVKDKRQGPQFCVSNPEVRKLALDWVRDQLKRRPELDMVSLETSDGHGHCECEQCKKLGNVSDRAFGLANEAARMLAKEHPGKMIGMLAYSDHCEPPSFPLEPNVYVQSTAGFIEGRYTFEELMELWPKHCKSMGFYEYYSVWPWDFDMPASGRGGNLKHICRQVPRFVELGATSLDCESGNNWGPHGLGYYIANKLMWNPKADVDALLADFYAKAFGPAAAAMRRYYERLDSGNQQLVSEHLFALALRDLEEASRAAKDRPDVLARLDQLKQYQHYVRLRYEHDRTADKKRKQELALAALTHCYRTRYTYMNHWAAQHYGWSQAAAKEFDQPSWSYREKAGQPWKVDAPVTVEETDRLFREDLAYFQPQSVDEKQFSTDLVPAGFRSPKPADNHQRYQRVERYALYSQKGEELAVTITTGVIAWYRDRPAARYTITNSTGKEIAKGQLPQDGQEHPLRTPVPTAGLYWLEFHDQSAGWGIKAPAGQPLALALRTGPRHIHLGQMQRMFFYVPKGTPAIQYFWDGPSHDVHGSDGKVVQKIDTKGKFVTIAVPAGQDGQVWSLGRLGLGSLWFFNVPNYLAASPDALLVPREVAVKDGLIAK
jgi:hypothetical protein